jgi:membrane protein YdbS with pleckstrin-like domain
MPNLTPAENRELLLELLQSHEVFGDFPELEQFVNRAEFIFREQGTKIIKQGEQGDTFYILISGQLRALDMNHDPPHLLNYLAPSSLFGTRALLEHSPRSATIEVVIDARLAVFDKNDWDWLIHRNDRIETYCRNLERSFEQPARVDFPGRQWDEVVVIWVKRHVLDLLAKLTFPVALLIAPILFLIIEELMGMTFASIITDNLFWTALATLPFILLSAFLAIYYYLDWRNDDFIVTTKRVIHIERILLYGEQRDEAPLVRIQDVTVMYHNLLSQFFDFHDLAIKTAGAGVIKITSIPEADRIQEIIFAEQERARARVGAADLAAVRQMIASRLDWHQALEQTVISVAEEEVTLDTEVKQGRLPVGLEYLWPRVKEISEDEHGPVIVWRKHYVVLLAAILLPALAFCGLAYLWLASIFILPPFNESAGSLIYLFLGVATVANLIWYLWRYDGWRQDLYMVTNQRIVDVEGTPFHLRGEQRREGTFEYIQNITYDIPNFIAKLLNLGTVVIETAGTERTFTFQKVFNPSAVQEEIFKRMVQYQQRQREKVRDANTDRLVEVLAEYHQLMEKAESRPNPNQS